jgi:hypothetical protein
MRKKGRGNEYRGFDKILKREIRYTFLDGKLRKMFLKKGHIRSQNREFYTDLKI